MSEHLKYMKEAADLRDRLKAKNIFIFVFGPDGEPDRVVCGGELDIPTAIKLVDVLGTLQEKIAADLKARVGAKKTLSDQSHQSN